MQNKLNELIVLLKSQIGLLLGISLGVFLFILFFEPFNMNSLEYNNRLLIISGLAFIVFVSMLLIRIIFPFILSFFKTSNLNYYSSAFIGGFSVLTLSGVAFPFYLHYVGKVEITFYMMFKVVFICLAPAIILNIKDSISKLKIHNKKLVLEHKDNIKKINIYEINLQNKIIDFVTENNSESLSLRISDISFIKSADNYVEVYFFQDEEIKKKLLRTTLRNIEQQLKPYTNFVRCHRICIVNTDQIQSFTRDSNNHTLSLFGYPEQIPVSRQYLLHFKSNT